MDEDALRHRRAAPVAALIFGVTAFLSKPGQTLAPLAGAHLLQLGAPGSATMALLEAPAVGDDAPAMLSSAALGQVAADSLPTVFAVLVWIPMACAAAQLLVWSLFSLHGARLRYVHDALASVPSRDPVCAQLV